MPQGGNNPGAFQQTFEKVDKATAGVAGQVKDAVTDAAKESVQQIAQAPLDILKTLIGVDDSGAESSTGGSSDPNDPQAMATGPNGQPTEFGRKLEEERKKREALLRQHRSVLAQYEQAFKQKQSQEENQKEQEEHQEEQIKEQKKIEQKKKQDPAWMASLKQRIGGGKGEVGKTTH